MANQTRFCPLLGAYVAAAFDVEHMRPGVLCDYHSAPSGICRLKEQAQRLRVLSRLLEHVAGEPSGDIQCYFSR